MNDMNAALPGCDEEVRPLLGRDADTSPLSPGGERGSRRAFRSGGTVAAA